jgi:hypothetical protein
MNGPIEARTIQTDALTGDLRACEDSPRPIARPPRSSNTRIGGQR